MTFPERQEKRKIFGRASGVGKLILTTFVYSVGKRTTCSRVTDFPQTLSDVSPLLDRLVLLSACRRVWAEYHACIKRCQPIHVCLQGGGKRCQVMISSIPFQFGCKSASEFMGRAGCIGQQAQDMPLAVKTQMDGGDGLIGGA